VRIVVIGLGLIGRQRAEAARRLGVELVATVDPAAEGLAGVTHLPALDHAPEYDAAIVAVPHHLAGDLVRRVLRAGAPVLVEKPLGLTAPEARELADAADAVDRPSFVGYNYRFLPTVREVLRRVAAGELGALRSVDFVLGHGGNPGSAEGWKLDPARAGGGVLLDPGVHLLDLLLRLAPGARPGGAVAGRGFWGTGIEEDVAAVFADGDVVASLRLSHVRWVNTFRIEVSGEEGYAIIEGRGGTYGAQTVRFGRRWAWRDSGAAQRDTEEVHDFGSENVSLDAELEAVLRAWRGEPAAPGPTPCTMDEAVAVAELCDELYALIGRAGTTR